MRVKSAYMCHYEYVKGFHWTEFMKMIRMGSSYFCPPHEVLTYTILGLLMEHSQI